MMREESKEEPIQNLSFTDRPSVESIEGSSSAQPAQPLRIGIVGAGLVGCTAALAFSRLDGVRVTVFEKAPVPREAGAWISLTVTGLRVLNKLIPPAEVNAIIYRPPDKAVYVMRHWRTGEQLIRRYSSAELRDEYVQGRTHRPPLLRLLVRHIPDGIVECGRRVVDLEVRQREVELRFTDGQSRSFDLVVAADGIYSGIRGKLCPGHSVGFRGTVAYRTVFPMSRVSGIKGLYDDSSAWRKDGEVVFLSELGLGMYGIVIIRGESPEYASKLQWERSIGPDGLQRLRDLYKAWDPLIPQVLDVIDDIDAYPLDSGPWLETLVRESCVAFVGDAAHPTAGAYGAGAAMGFGDCWALYRSLQAARARDGSRYDVPRALRIFDETRRHFLRRVEQQITLDRGDAKYVAEAAADEEEWKRRFVERNLPNQWLTEHDVELEVQKVIMGESLLDESTRKPGGQIHLQDTSRKVCESTAVKEVD